MLGREGRHRQELDPLNTVSFRVHQADFFKLALKEGVVPDYDGNET
jgi:hypothetical protein